MLKGFRILSPLGSCPKSQYSYKGARLKVVSPPGVHHYEGRQSLFLEDMRAKKVKRTCVRGSKKMKKERNLFVLFKKVINYYII